MALADFDHLVARIGAPSQMTPMSLAGTTAQSRWYDLWDAAPPVGAVPTSAVVPTNATAGSLGQQNPASGSLGIVGARMNATNSGIFMICDRLSHQGGLSGTVTTPQTTNLDTAALTRYTSGVGVMLGISIYTQVGSTGTTISATYTNTDPTGSRVTPLVPFGGTNHREARRCIVLPLQVGDVGVTSVQSVTVTATTGTAGNFGVTLFKPLYAVLVDEINCVAVVDLITGKVGGGIPAIADDACLYAMCLSTGVSALATGALLLGEW